MEVTTDQFDRGLFEFSLADVEVPSEELSEFSPVLTDPTNRLSEEFLCERRALYSALSPEPICGLAESM
jgi:hypothetical protein